MTTSTLLGQPETIQPADGRGREDARVSALREAITRVDDWLTTSDQAGIPEAASIECTLARA